MSVFVVSFPLMVVALRDFGPATATLARMLAGAAVLAVAARGRFGRLRGYVPRIAIIGAFGLGIQSWLLAYAMTHVGGALPALVLGLEPIVIGLVGSLVVREHVSGRLKVAFALGLVGEAVIAGFVTAGPGERPLLPLAALAAVVLLFSAYSVSLRQLAALPSAAIVCVSSLGGAVAVLPIVLIEVVRGDAIDAIHPGALAALAFAGFAAAGLGSLAWAAVLSRMRAAIAALGLYLVPLGGAIASHVGLDEPLYARHAIGAADRGRCDPARSLRAPSHALSKRPPRLEVDAPLQRHDVRLPDERARLRADEGAARVARARRGDDAGGRRRGRLQHLHDPREGRRALPLAPDARPRGEGARSAKVIVVGGCWSESMKDELFELYPFVDLAFGPGNISRLGDFIQAGGEVPRGHFSTFDEFSGDLPMRRERPLQAWLQISMGCNSTCSYCIVPSVRGREQSRLAELLVAEVERSRGTACARSRCSARTSTRGAATCPWPSGSASAGCCGGSTPCRASSASATRARTRRTCATT